MTGNTRTATYTSSSIGDIEVVRAAIKADNDYTGSGYSVTKIVSSTESGFQWSNFIFNHTIGGGTSCSSVTTTTTTSTTTTTTAAPTTTTTEGCILAGELILMEDGTSKKVEDVVVGDRVKGIGLPGLSLEEDSWVTWSTNDVDFTSSNTITEVKAIQSEVFNTAFNLTFNTGSLKVTGEHPVLTKREDGSVLFIPVRDLLEGDAIRYFPSNSWEPLTSIEILENNAIMSYNLDAEAVDNYVAGGVIVHNAANIDKEDNICPSYPAPCNGYNCLVEGTPILLADGSQTAIEELKVGDILYSVDIDGLPLNQTRDEEFAWSSTGLKTTPNQTTIIDIVPTLTNEVISINDGLLEATWYHLQMVERDGVWKIMEFKEIKTGDKFIDVNGNLINVDKIENITKDVTVYKLDVEDRDVYYANNILTHNK